MRKLILALGVGAALGITCAAVEAMPVATVSGSVTPTPHVEKTVVVVRRAVVRRPARRICSTRIGLLGRRVTVCR